MRWGELPCSQPLTRRKSHASPESQAFNSDHFGFTASLWLHCIEANRLQAGGVRGKLFLACWKPVRRQNKGDHAGRLFAGQMSSIIAWHALLYVLKEIADGQAVPIFLKPRARQIRGALTPHLQHIGAMAQRALLVINNFPAACLLLHVHAIPYRYSLLRLNKRCHDQKE